MPQHSLITEQNGTLMEPLIEHQAAVMPQPPQPQEPLAPHNPEPQAVAGMPRLFVGQVPTDKAEQDLYPLFAPYGVIEKITMVRGPEGKSRGCAMVQFKRWAEAESAMDALNGTSPLEGGKGRPLVVHFANPRRSVGNQVSEPAIAPRKLFVGQIPKTAGEQDLLTVFSPFGEVESVNILKSKGLHAGCAFVQFRKWASCEAAIEALHEQMVMPGCEHPLVVKFADAKRRDQEHLKRRDGPTQHQDLFDLNAKQKQMMAMGMGMMGMSGLMGGPHPMMGGMMGGESMMALPGMSMSMPGMGLAGSPSSVAPTMHLSLAGGNKMDGGLHSTLDGSSRDSLLAEGMEGLSVNGSALGLADGLHGAGIGGHGINGNGNMGGLPGMGMMGGMPGADGLMGGMGSHMMLGASGAQQRGKLGRGVNDPAAYAHKLFIGQIPFEANEQDLWALFAPAGDILELAILRSQGRSKGCAFLTYASRAQAMTAINAFNGRPAGPNKKLVVKFADQK